MIFIKKILFCTPDSTFVFNFHGKYKEKIKNAQDVKYRFILRWIYVKNVFETKLGWLVLGRLLGFFVLKFINAAKFVILLRNRKKKCKFGKLILKALFSFLRIECQNTVFTCKLSKIYSTKKKRSYIEEAKHKKKVFMRPDPGHIPKMWNIFYIPNEW